MRKNVVLMKTVAVAIVFALMVAPVQAQEGPVTYDGVEFPLGDKSFADQVVGFNPGSGTGESDGSAAIGPPDGGKGTGPSVIGAKGDVTLGKGGSITLKFTDNYLIDVEGLDLYVFEYGPDVESFKVEISKDGSGWIDLGTVRGQPTGLDIHGRVAPGDRFSYVRITDANPYAPRDPKIIGTEAYEGADIDAVGAIGAEERPDSDGDGIPDDEDWCPDTPQGTEVDEDGCPVEVLDSDGDGVPDDEDWCPDTPLGTEVDEYGCPVEVLDSDGDGVPDDEDWCPGTALGTEVDEYGCPVEVLDSDGDGVPDDEDWCPDTALGTEVDEYGCPVEVLDSDGDGVPDDEDWCPDTAQGTEVDEYGCPIPEACRISLSPSPAYVMPGGSVEISGQAVWADGQPIANALIDVSLGGLEGAGYVSPSRTDSQGHFRFTYAAPQDVGGLASVNLTVRVEGCPASATVTVYFGPTPAPTGTPTATASPTPTGSPTPTETPVPPTLTPTATKEPGDLSIQRVVLLQAVEGGQLVAGRPVGVRVFFSWTGSQPVGVEVIATLDDNAVPQTPPLGRGQVKASYDSLDRYFGRDAINLVLPASLSWVLDETRTLEITAQLIGRQDSDPSNNATQLTFQTFYSFPPTILFVSVNESIGYGELMTFAGRAKRYMDQVYPMPYVSVIRNAAYLATNIFGTSYGTAIQVERARQRYNSERCRRPDGTSISPCNAPWAKIAVGVFPDWQFGHCIEGFLYGSGGNAAKDWGAQFVFGGTISSAALVREQNPVNTAHEIGHHYGFRDEYGSGTLGVQIPAGVSTWQYGRFRTEDFGGGRQLNPCYNFMGNAGLGDQGSPGCAVAWCTWVNAETWNTLLNRHTHRAAVAGAQIASLRWVGALVEEGPVEEIEGEALLVAGTIDQQGQAAILSADRIHRYESWMLVEGEWALEALDAGGNVLSTRSFTPVPDDASAEMPFLVTLPVDDPAQVAEVRLTREGQPVASITRSSSAPAIVLDPLPSFGDVPVTLNWRVEDADGGTHRFNVLYSSDGGQTWQVLGVDLPETSLQLDPAMLSGGEARFRVTVSDGLNEAEAVSVPVSLPDRPPLAHIDLPWGDVFAADETVIIDGHGYDLEDGELPPTQLRWQDEAGQSLGQGPQLQLASLPGGEHRIVLLAQDSTGQTGQAEVTVTVEGEPLTGLVSPFLPLFLFATSGIAGLAAFALLIFLLVRRRKPAPAVPPVTPPARPVRPRGRPEELVSRGPPGRPEGPPERLGGGKPSGPPETLD